MCPSLLRGRCIFIRGGNLQPCIYPGWGHSTAEHSRAEQSATVNIQCLETEQAGSFSVLDCVQNIISDMNTQRLQ